MGKMSLRVGCRADDADKHISDVTSLLFKNGKLYSGGNDGKIKNWSMDLTKLVEVQAHERPIYSLAASNDTLYSCSSDGSVKAFSLDNLSPKGNVVHENKTEFWKLYYSGGCLYAGDDEGTMKVWKDGQYYGSLLIAEPIKDMAISHHIAYTVKDTDLTITEVKVDSDVLQFGVKKTYTGSAPVTLVGDKYVAFLSRVAKDILVYENNDQTHFKEVAKFEVRSNFLLQCAHDMIISALAGTTWNNKSIIFSGGWDKKLKKWSVNGTLNLDSTLDVDLVANAIAIGDQGEIYVGGTDGHIVRVEVE
ncbi:hypothetical protein NQ317_002010 [Molorchus minor]|uniref:Uncharacterized protein n=1 Tax=Molorchus minor TaxID=1323400 RepID=A0ABQ9IRH2_9CUCU|nr:hypothetical protein NQ317_002010 [Molorchus minor]